MVASDGKTTINYILICSQQMHRSVYFTLSIFISLNTYDPKESLGLLVSLFRVYFQKLSITRIAYEVLEGIS